MKLSMLVLNSIPFLVRAAIVVALTVVAYVAVRISE